MNFTIFVLCFLHLDLTVAYPQTFLIKLRLRERFKINCVINVNISINIKHNFLLTVRIFVFAYFQILYFNKQKTRKKFTHGGDGNLSTQEANKLHSRAASMTFDDISTCINVSRVSLSL